ncbi:MAG: membrane protein insertion efficiency factor YidD [Sphaerospermopsis sp. SIO1G2]|nr:membrane protein insertion efficiency factor YidD [Sphaerospermopsis sp. SIO1G2]
MTKNLIATEISWWNSVVRKIGILTITGYQKYVSPHKGFACAHRVLYGGESCSQYVKRVMAKKGVKAALAKSRVRFQHCKQANFILKSQVESQKSPVATRLSQQQDQHQEKARKSYFQECSDQVGTNCCELSCDCFPDMVDVTSDCGSMDCGSMDCGSMDGGSMDCGSMDCSSCFLDFGSCG